VAAENTWIKDHGGGAVIIGVVVLVVIGALVLRFTQGPTNPIICNNNGRFCYYQRTDHYVGEPSSIDFKGRKVPADAVLPQSCETYECRFVGQVGNWAIWQTGRTGLVGTWSSQTGQTPTIPSGRSRRLQ
jgi:hypothetical protein